MLIARLARCAGAAKSIVNRNHIFHYLSARHFVRMVEPAKTRITNVEETEKLLESLKTIRHPPVFTVAEMMEKCKSDKGPLTYCKNLFIVNKKANEHLLIVALHDTEVDLKMLRKWLNVGSRDLRFGDEAVLKELIGAEKGSVNPFSLANDKENKVKLIVDKKMYETKSLSFHPMQNDALTEISTEDFKKFIAGIGKSATVVDFVQLKKEVEEEVIKGPKKEEKKQPGKKQPGGKKKENKKAEEAASEEEEKHKLGIEYSKAENWPMWYQQVLKKAEMIEYCSDVSGCYVLRPWSYTIWERVQSALDSRFKDHGVENAYFPMFVTKGALEKETSHVEGFKAEVAWVTKSGDTELQEPIAIRPTSETIMYPYYQKWIRSHRDLPLKLNQWTNVVRWEFKDPTPFIRTREFLWQEGHTAHATLAESDKMVQDMLEVYKYAYEQLLAVPVIKGVKSEEEKFPGALYTTSIETVIPTNGRGVQAATSHNLGQNFSKMFEIYFENEKCEKDLVWQTSWGFTTRSVGVMILMHGDNKGLILPPRVAPIQIVMVPIHYTSEERDKLLAKMKEFEAEFGKAGLRTKIDDRALYRPGWKFNYWELKGVPLRIEFGMKDYKASAVTVVRRDTGEKKSMKWEEMSKGIPELLEKFHNELLERARKELNETIVKASNWEDFMKNVNNRKACMAPWCKSGECERQVKAKSKAESKKYAEIDPSVMTGSVKTLNIPFESEPIQAGEKCFACGGPAVCRALWGRSY